MIELSRCEDFDLGPVRIRPSSREISTGAKVTVIEPKVMLLLVTLAEQVGRVVPRDDLIEQCWQGRVVGEDAINRVIGKLRRAAKDAAGGAFRIETVARVGLRLVVGDQAPASAGGASIVRAGGRRWAGRSAIAVVLGLVALFAFWTWRSAPSPRPTIRGIPLPAAVTDLETRGLSAMFENTPERTAAGVAYLRQATVAAPRSASTWGSLAMSYVLTLGWVRPTERAAVALRVRDAAAHALAIDPRESRAAAALVSLVPTFGNWRAKAAALRGWEKRVHHDNGPLRYQQVQFLMAAGRERKALELSEGLAKSSPLVPWIQAAYIDLLAADGRLEEADHVAATALATWPRDPLIWFTSFDLAAYYGRPERALAMAADRAAWPERTPAEDILLSADMVRAMTSGSPGEAETVLNAYKTRSSLGQGHAERAMRAAAALGRLDEAMMFARQLYRGHLRAEPRSTMLPHIGLPADCEPPTAALFLPPARALQRHRDYAILINEIGLSGNNSLNGPVVKAQR